MKCTKLIFVLVVTWWHFSASSDSRRLELKFSGFRLNIKNPSDQKQARTKRRRSPAERWGRFLLDRDRKKNRKRSNQERKRGSRMFLLTVKIVFLRWFISFKMSWYLFQTNLFFFFFFSTLSPFFFFLQEHTFVSEGQRWNVDYWLKKKKKNQATFTHLCL